MKITLNPGQFVFTPSTNTISFSNMSGLFSPERLLAVINTTTGKLMYASASYAAGYGGTFSTSIYINDTLTYASSNAGQGASDILQCLYDDQYYSQQISGTITTFANDYEGNGIGSVNDPVDGNFRLKTASTTYASDGTPILSTVDPISGGDGLNVHLQSSAYGGELGQPLPSAAYGYQSALSMAFLNGSTLSAPKMDPVTNELIVQGTFTAPALQDVNLTQIGGNSSSVNQGASDSGTLRVAANNYTSSGYGLEYGNGIIGAGAQRMALGDYAFSGPASITGPVNNLITGGGTSTDLNGYRYFSIQIVCTATAGTFIFETSNDDTNWQPLAVSNQSLTTGVIITSAITATASSFIYVGTITGRYIRIRIITGLTGGSAQAVCRFSQVAPLANNVTISSGSASTVAPNIDVLGSAVSGSRYNQIEIDFNTVPSGTLITNTTTGSGTITASNGHSLYATSSTASSSAKGVSVGIVQYRAANELYSYFSAAFTVSGGARTGSSYQRIGIYDTTNGFFIGYSGLNFGVTKRTGGADSFTIRTAWNGDLLDGNPASKFTRNNIPEAINFALSNLFRIRFAWLGSACILFDVYSPDGIWVNYHTIKQPNADFNPSLTVPNLPMTIDCAKNSSLTEVLTIATACWAGGTTSEYSPITSTLTDNSLAGLNRSVITGVTTGGGGGYVNVKVNPSGALVTDSTISSSVLPTGAATSANQTNGTQTNRITDGTNTSAVKAASTAPLATDPALVVSLSPNSATGSLATSALQTTGNTTLTTISGKLPAALGTQTTANSLAVNIASDQSAINTFLPDLYITGASTLTLGNNLLLAVAGAGETDATGYKSGCVQVITTATSGAIIFEGSNSTNTATFQPIPAFRIDSASPNANVTAISITAASNFMYIFPIRYRYIRLRISTALGVASQALTRLSQDPFVAPVVNVINGTAANLNATVAGALTSVGTITTVTGVTTVSTVTGVTTVSAITAANLASTIVTDLNAQSVITTGTSSNIATANQQSHSFGVTFVYTTGTGTIDVTIQESYDNGTSWVDVYTLDRVGTAGTTRQNIPAMKIGGNLVRYSWVITGSITTATMTVQRTNRAGAAPSLRRIYDRTLVTATLASSSAAVFTEGCEFSDLVINMAAGGTAPIIQLQGSEDSTNWYNIGTALTAAVGATTALSIADGSLPRFTRATVGTAGVGSTLGYIAIKAKGAS
jgi:hypothetical protein